jgi:hypothetical protein
VALMKVQVAQEVALMKVQVAQEVASMVAMIAIIRLGPVTKIDLSFFFCRVFNHGASINIGFSNSVSRAICICSSFGWSWS